MGYCLWYDRIAWCIGTALLLVWTIGLVWVVVEWVKFRRERKYGE